MGRYLGKLVTDLRRFASKKGLNRRTGPEAENSVLVISSSSMAYSKFEVSGELDD
jgi:hypothetical protein